MLWHGVGTLVTTQTRLLPLQGGGGFLPLATATFVWNVLRGSLSLQRVVIVRKRKGSFCSSSFEWRSELLHVETARCYEPLQRRTETAQMQLNDRWDKIQVCFEKCHFKMKFCRKFFDFEMRRSREFATRASKNQPDRRRRRRRQQQQHCTVCSVCCCVCMSACALSVSVGFVHSVCVMGCVGRALGVSVCFCGDVCVRISLRCTPCGFLCLQVNRSWKWRARTERFLPYTLAQSENSGSNLLMKVHH